MLLVTAEDTVQTQPHYGTKYSPCKRSRITELNTELKITELNLFEHAVVRLCLHGERAEAHKEQVKSVSNVRQHKEGEGEETNPCSDPR